MKYVCKFICKIIIVVIMLGLISGCGKARNVYVDAVNKENPSWSVDSIKFAQDFRGALESGEESQMAEDAQDNLYNVTIQTDLGHWEFQLYISLEDLTQDAFSKDESGVTRKISEYNAQVIRQIFSDVTEKGINVLS